MGGADDHVSAALDDDSKDSESDGDAAEEILEESPCKRWSKRREQVKQRDVPGIDVAYLAMDNETGNEVVWNEVQFSERKNFKLQEEKINFVFDNLTHLVHTNLVKFHKYWTDAKSEKPRIIFITEYMSAGSMSFFLQRTRKSGSPLSIKAWKKWTTQILSALNYLHSSSPPITHGNLTCNTVFIQQNGLIKIGSVAPDAIHHHVKTCRDNLRNMHYIAPEYDTLLEVTPAADIYSFGICALEIAVIGGLCGCQNGSSEGPITQEVIEKATRSLEDPRQRDFIEQCLRKDPLDRPTARQLLFHPVLFEVHSLKLLSAHAIVDSQMYDETSDSVFRIPDNEKVAAVTRLREIAYCQVPAFQVDLEKFVEDVRNGIYPLTAFGPMTNHSIRNKPETGQSTNHSTTNHTTTKSSEPLSTPLSLNAVPRSDPDPTPSPPAPVEEDAHKENRSIVSMKITADGRELTVWLQLEDSMNRQLTTEIGEDDNADTLVHNLVHHGFICEADGWRLKRELSIALGVTTAKEKRQSRRTEEDHQLGLRPLNPTPHTVFGCGKRRQTAASSLTSSTITSSIIFRLLPLAALLVLNYNLVDAQHGTVGRPCEVSTDCGTGNYCAGNKRCACLTTYVEIDSYCWRKINPGESGCTQNRQCEAVWPGAYCRSGECRCANNQPPFRTRDGLVCLNYGFCPLNGNNPKFRIENQVQQCYGGADATCEAIGALSYDCICDSDDCTVNNPISFCCPSRAFACIQPPNEGYTPPGGGTTLNHWYHDPITSECRELKYQGYGGNANNFQTKDHCESYCKQTCNRGLPLYRDRTTGVKQEPVYCQGNDSGCNNPNYQCTTMGTLQQCCPTYLFICSRNGGIPTEVYNTAGGLPTEFFDVGIPDGSGSTSPRFYYDSREGRCIQFSYLGQGGNFNNFLSQDHCEKFCSRILCSAGEPLKDSSGERNMECSPTGSGANSCPSTHSCESTSGSTTFGGVCCPRPQYVCKLPREQGNCGTYSNRWWFNAKTGNCEEFIYSGCQGNANNFETYKECQDYCRDARSEPQCIQGTALTDNNGNFIICGGSSAASTTCPANHYCYYDGTTYGCCPTQAYTCSLSYKSGASCGPAVTRWYYDSTTRTCQTYNFNGCDGNSNNFATQQDCKDYCRVESCPDGGEVWKEQNGAARACTTNRQCPSTHYCTPVTTWTGTVYQTKSLCCPSKNYVCSQPRDVGVRCSSTRISRWYFNADSKTCQTFEYNGCEGNRNNFASQKSCQNYCLSESCPPGTVVAKDGDGGSRLVGNDAVQCSNPGGNGRTSGGCPEGYTCYSSPLLDQNVCCGASTELQSLCPTSSTPFISALSLQPMQCTPNVDGACPGNFFCWFSTTTTSVNAFYCCRSPDSVDTGYCPPQLIPVPGESGAQYKYCSPSAPLNDAIQGCGANRHCQFSTNLERYICCGLESDVRLPNVCPPQPANLVPVELAGNYRTCNPYARGGTPQSCPDNSACLYTGNDNGFICCRVQLGSGGKA